jgi:hypothetical protein
MTYVEAFTITVYLVINLPLLRVIWIHDSRRVFPQLFGHAPNQFLFLIIFHPVATWSMLKGWSFLFEVPKDAGVTASLVSFWPWILASGAIAAAIFAWLDYRETAPDFDQLNPRTAADAVKAEAIVWRYLSNWTDAKTGRKERDKLLRDAELKAEEPLIGRSLGLAVDDAEPVLPPADPKDASTIDEAARRSAADAALKMKATEAARFLHVVCNLKEDEKPIACDTVCRVLNAYELAVALLAVLFTIMGIAILFSGRNLGLKQLGLASKWFIVSSLMHCTYAVFRTYNRREIQQVCRDARSINGEAFTLLVTLLAAALLIGFYRPQLSSISAVSSLVTAVLAGISYAVARARPELLRPVLGSGVTWGNLFLTIVTVILCLIALIVGILT